jgi:ABC-2 type transport system ATP-binding protein
MSIRVKEISKKYGKQVALDKLSFEIESGEVVGFLGPNGAGKSTMMKILTGYLPPDGGKAYICGQKVESEKTAFRSKIGYLPEHNPLYPEMYIREYLQLVAGFYNLKNKKQRVEEVVEMTGLVPEVSKKIGALSKGYRQRVGLAQALIHDPEVLILDEPTSGLDPNQLDEIRNLITHISTNKTVMLSTHIMQEVEAICKRVIIIHNGKLVADGSTSEIKKMSKGAGQQVHVEFSHEIKTEVFSALPFVASAKKIEEGQFMITSSVDEDIRPLLFKAAVKNNWILISLSEQIRSVENIFRELTT